MPRRLFVCCFQPAPYFVAAACLLAATGPLHAQVTDLVVSESGDAIVLTWSTGTPPYRVLRSDTPDFFFGNRLVADDLLTGIATDPGALAPGRPSYFYRVLEDGEPDPPGWELNPPPPVPFLTELMPDARRSPPAPSTPSKIATSCSWASRCSSSS